ncbi:C13 family peptidase [Ramlibacter sp. PS4R-6]|uniref:C13 family peptidase n=1 Tax=Ramlibacter sp. PS4R-6 TaxID=3133438 RepID=UPI0030A512E0
MPEPERLPLARWIAEGLRAGVLLRPRVGGAQPTPWQVAALVALWSLLEIALGRLEVAGDAHFDLRGWLVPWWSTAAMLLMAWWVLPRREEAGETPRGLAAWFALWITAVVPINCFAQLVSIAQAYDAMPAWFNEGDWRAWLVYLVLWVWILAMGARLAAAFDVRPRANTALTAGFALLFAIAAWQFPDRPWQPDALAQGPEGKPQLQLSQETFEAQQGMLRQAAANLAPERPGVVDVYGVVFSPYANEDVFLREGTMVTRLLEERFDAAGRVMQLANHATTAEALPWATPANLDRAIAAAGEKMDRERDVLFVYLTSHGAKDFKLEAANAPLAVDPVSPGELRQALDNAGIRHRVIVVSACYAGGWVGPLADEHTLVMTAADATHTSFGCGVGSELTFFGRALFDEQLRKTHSLEQAFAAAVPVIREREQAAGKSDGFSNPLMQVGEKIRPLLRELEQRLDAAPK